MSYAQQALYKMCDAVGTDQVRRTLEALKAMPHRDLNFLMMRSVLSFYLRDNT